MSHASVVRWDMCGAMCADAYTMCAPGYILTGDAGGIGTIIVYICSLMPLYAAHVM